MTYEDGENERQYHLVGQLEKSGIEPLPLTPMSEAARNRLLEWGLTDDEIERVREFSSSFRYDRCAEKVEQLAKTPVFIDVVSGREIASLPNFIDVKGRLHGQCLDIAYQVIMQAEFSGLLADINARRPKGSGRITCGFGEGLSRTHFNQKGKDGHPGNNHVWNKLSLIDDNDEVLDSILLDAAFQVIMTPEESGYGPRSTIPEASDALLIDPNIDVQIGWVNITPRSCDMSIPNTVVLGLSNDRKYAYSVGFCRRSNSESKEIVPMLSRRRAEGTDEIFFLDPDTGVLVNNITQSLLTLEEELEIRAILNNCKKFTFSTDMSLYPRHRDKYTIQF